MTISQTQFRDVSIAANITRIGRTWGASWGDFNGDTYPDLYLNHHQDPDQAASLYLNQGDGTFTDIAPDVLEPAPPGEPRDNHGSAWADFDNDGDADLIQIPGGATGTAGNLPNPRISNQLYVNESGQLQNQADQFGVTYQALRGRTPLWQDYDSDGLLDLILTGFPQPNTTGPTTIFRQTENGFEDVRSSIGIDVSRSKIAFLADLSGDDDLELVFSKTRQPRLEIYDVSSSPFTDVTDAVTSENIRQLGDAAAADFNGDLKTDLYIANSNPRRTSEVLVNNEGQLLARLQTSRQILEQGIQFQGSTDVEFDLFLSPFLTTEQIFIGADALRADEAIEFVSLDDPSLYQGEWQFTVSADDDRFLGIPPEAVRNGQDGVYLGYDNSNQTWEIYVSGTNEEIDLIATSTTNAPLLDAIPIGFESVGRPFADQLLINTDQGLVDQSELANINSSVTAGVSVVAADFDNDMDVDVYILNSGLAQNTPNVLYDNQGDGTFIPVADAGGAEGATIGLGDVVVSADYDLDGFVDLFVANGAWPPPFTDEGPAQLFQNQGNGNHWLEIDLEGVVSNRDGVGAKVYVTAGGVTQVREQNNGIHLFAQNQQRLHFGLANNTNIDEILVRWPNGEEQRVENIPANQLIRIVEEPDSTFAASDPDIRIGNDGPGVFLWKETFDGPYHLRTVGNSDETVNFALDVLSTDALLDVQGVKLEANDTLTTSDFGLSFNSEVKVGQDGLTFNVAPGAKTLFAVTQDGIANPRQVYVGSDRNRLAPQGWILNSEDFETRPNFKTGQDLGLFVGRDNSSEDTLEFRWTGDGRNHIADLEVLASDSNVDFSPVALENGDSFTRLENGIDIQSKVGGGLEGLDVTTTNPVNLGFTYEQDGLNQVHRVNRGNSFLGFENAYELPVASPLGAPDINNAQDRGLFLWKDDVSELWHLRATAGGGSLAQYTGSIISNAAADVVNQVGIETGDQVNLEDSTRIDFSLGVAGPYKDELVFRFPDEAELSLQLTSGEELLRVGAQEWQVSQVPLELTGW